MIHKIPKHIAIIMDGNSRWAKKQKVARSKGHLAGTHTVKKILIEATKLGVQYLTLYTFSTENWNRSKLEVNTLFRLFTLKLKDELPSLQKNNVRLRIMGDLSVVNPKTQKQIQVAIDQTKKNTGIQLILALSYSGRQEIISATQKITQKVLNKSLQLDQINEQIFTKHLYCPDVPDPDLIIRTGQFNRLSNFLLWQAAYSEIYTTPLLWPDFNEQNLQEAITYYQQVKRNFGTRKT